MKIKKFYTRLCNIGNFENIKVGVELELDVTGVSKARDIQAKALAMGKLAKILVDHEIQEVKKENEREVE